MLGYNRRNSVYLPSVQEAVGPSIISLECFSFLLSHALLVSGLPCSTAAADLYMESRIVVHGLTSPFAEKTSLVSQYETVEMIFREHHMI